MRTVVTGNKWMEWSWRFVSVFEQMGITEVYIGPHDTGPAYAVGAWADARDVPVFVAEVDASINRQGYEIATALMSVQPDQVIVFGGASEAAHVCRIAKEQGIPIISIKFTEASWEVTDEVPEISKPYLHPDYNPVHILEKAT